jgi:hypothetical protein
MYAHARPTYWGDPTGNAPGDLWDPRSYDWDVFAKEVGKRSIDVTANVLTLGGYGGVKRGLAEGRVTATDGSSGVEAYAQGVFNTITLGGGERAVEGYAEGQGGAGVVVEGITGVAETVLPISETKTILDPTTTGWEKAEAFATGVTKVATLAAGGIAGKNALAGRAAAAEQAAIRTRVLNNIAESQAARQASRFGAYAEAEAAAARGATASLVAPKSTPSLSQRPSDSPFYEAGFEARLREGVDYPGVSDQRHFQAANRQLHEAMEADQAFAAQMEELYPGLREGVAPGARGAFPRRSPTPDTTWHHNATREGILELVPRSQHRAPGTVQESLHPARRGGMEEWGGGRGE